ncbi:MAG: hypothetical protein IKP10_05815 [Clostridia bacterium]|nr:hypothetical protein [Clostridia bacterium]
MDKLTPEMITTFLVVAAVLVGFVLAVWGLIDKIKSARKPKDDLAQWQRETDTKLNQDKGRLDSLEDGQRVMLRGVNALISHEINGNSTDKLLRSQQEILDYLIDK